MHNFSNSIVGPGPGAMLIYKFDCSEGSCDGSREGKERGKGEGKEEHNPTIVGCRHGQTGTGYPFR